MQRINIVLDYVFIFILGWGMTGAALATSLGYIVGAGMILGYLGRRRNVVRLCRVKTSRKSMRLTLRNVGYMCRLGLSTFLCEGAIAMMMAMFIDSSCPACAIAVRGLPLFASGFVFFAVNIVSIGYFQSVERPRPAMAVTVLRGFVFMAACFFGLPLLLGVEGIWLAVPLAEALTFAVVAAIYGRTRLKSAF